MAAAAAAAAKSTSKYERLLRVLSLRDRCTQTPAWLGPLCCLDGTSALLGKSLAGMELGEGSPLLSPLWRERNAVHPPRGSIACLQLSGLRNRPQPVSYGADGGAVGAAAAAAPQPIRRQPRLPSTRYLKPNDKEDSILSGSLKSISSRSWHSILLKEDVR